MQEKCPECGKPLRFVGQKWECSGDPFHKIPFSGNRGYTGNTSTSIPPHPADNRGGNIQVVPLRYPVLRLPGESSGIMAPKLRCPFCDYEFRLNEATVVSTVNPGKVLRPGKSRVFFGPKGPLDKETFTSEMAGYQCPRCLLVLPYRYESSTNIYIGVIGDTYSGKTHYLAALLSLMEEGGMAHNAVFSSVRFVPQTEYTTKMLEEYRQVFEDQQEFAITRPFMSGKKDEIPLWKPLIFRMLIRHSTSIQESRSVNLVFYDLSGEDIADEARLAQYGWPVLRAHAFIYLADPLSMKGVVNLLSADKKPRADHLSFYAHRSSNEVLDSAIGVVRRWRGLAPDAQLSMPVAITISKSDMLDGIIPAAERQNAPFLNPVQYDGFVHVDDFMRNHEALSKWLVSMKEMQLRRSALYVPNSSFFAVSATGSSPNSVGKFASIQPRRCLDPLLWILWRFATGAY